MALIDEPRYKSDLTGTPIAPGDRAVIKISPDGDDFLYALDASMAEVAQMLTVAAKTRKPGRKKASENGGEVSGDATPGADGPEDTGETPGETPGDTDEKTTSAKGKQK